MEVIKYPVNEIFTSIQGEGTHMGELATFIRLEGCNLSCPWCDTKQSWQQPCRHDVIEFDSAEMDNSKMHCSRCGARGTVMQLNDLEVVPSGAKYRWMTPKEIASEVKSAYVVITGGEPTIHDLTPLLEELRMFDTSIYRYIALETNGTNPILLSGHGYVDWVTCSPKPPLYEIKCRCDELKFVVDEEFSFDNVKKIISGVKIWLQPESHKPESIKKAMYMVAQKPEHFRMGIQLHKVLGVR